MRFARSPSRFLSRSCALLAFMSSPLLAEAAPTRADAPAKRDCVRALDALSDAYMSGPEALVSGSGIGRDQSGACSVRLDFPSPKHLQRFNALRKRNGLSPDQEVFRSGSRVVRIVLEKNVNPIGR